MKTKKLEKFSPCLEAREYMKTQKSSTEAWMNCQRGDWMLWIAKKLRVSDKALTMAKAMCVKQVEHLMKDQRSRDALQACFDYVNGKITKEELNVFAANAYVAADAAYVAAYVAADAAYVAADAAYVAAYVAYVAANAAYVAAYVAYVAADADADAANAARINSLKKSANICREYLTKEVLSKYKRLR